LTNAPFEDPLSELRDISEQLGIKLRSIQRLRIAAVRRGNEFEGRFFAVARDDTKVVVGNAWQQPVPDIELDPSEYMSEAEAAAETAAFLAEHPLGGPYWRTPLTPPTELPDRPEDVFWFEPDDWLVLATIQQANGMSGLLERWVPEHRLDIHIAAAPPEGAATRLLAVRRALLAKAKRGRPTGARNMPPNVFASRFWPARDKVSRATYGRVTQRAVATEMGMPLSTFLRQIQASGIPWQDLKTGNLP